MRVDTEKLIRMKKSISGSPDPENRIVGIGTSLGGFHALPKILSALPADFTIPVVLVQHRGESSTALAVYLQENCRLRVIEPDDKDEILQGCVYVAPAGYHLMVSGSFFELSTGAKVNFSRPSIDVLFESMARNYGEHSIGIILSGANHDGARGLSEIQKSGGFTIVQHPETAESQAMPLAAIASCSVDRLLGLDEIGPFLASLQPTTTAKYPEKYGSIGI